MRKEGLKIIAANSILQMSKIKSWKNDMSICRAEGEGSDVQGSYLPVSVSHIADNLHLDLVILISLPPELS